MMTTYVDTGIIFKFVDINAWFVTASCNKNSELRTAFGHGTDFYDCSVVTTSGHFIHFMCTSGYAVTGLACLYIKLVFCVFTEYNAY